MESTTIDLSWLCIVVPLAMVTVAAVLGTRSRLRYARRIRAAQARGAFADMNTPETKSRMRRLAFLGLISGLGMVLSLVMLVQPWIKTSLSVGDILAAGIVFVIMGSVAGLLMQREIDRRL